MKKLILIAFLLPLFAKAQSVDQLDYKNGFKGFHFGDSLSKHISLLKLDTKTGWYTVKGKAIKINGYNTNSVNLRFENNILKAVRVFVFGVESSNGIHQAMKDAYGDGDESLKEDHARWVEWHGRTVAATLIKDAGGMYGLSLAILIEKTSDETIQGNVNTGNDL